MNDFIRFIRIRLLVCFDFFLFFSVAICVSSLTVVIFTIYTIRKYYNIILKKIKQQIQISLCQHYILFILTFFSYINKQGFRTIRYFSFCRVHFTKKNNALKHSLRNTDGEMKIVDFVQQPCCKNFLTFVPYVNRLFHLYLYNCLFIPCFYRNLRSSLFNSFYNTLLCYSCHLFI